MKTSHYKTPRTMAECEFVVGYPIADPNSSSEWRPVVVSILAILVILWFVK